MRQSSNDQLESAISRNELVAELGGVAVIGGLIAEVALTGIFQSGPSLFERWGPVGADAVIALGVAAEVLFSRRARGKSEELKRRTDAAVAALNERAEQANKAAAEASLRAAEADKRAAELGKEAADARLATERLKKEVSWRNIDPDMRRRLISALSKIPSKVVLVYMPGDPEATRYCAEFDDVFRRAKWKVEVAGRTFLGPPVGIFVSHGDRWNSDIQAEIDRVREVFLAAGLETKKGGGAVEARVDGLTLGQPTADLRIIVGHRPAPML